jgi:hypothetical protein
MGVVEEWNPLTSRQEAFVRKQIFVDLVNDSRQQECTYTRENNRSVIC